MDKHHLRFRPCNGRNMSICISSFILSFIFTIIQFSISATTDVKCVFLAVGCFFLLLNILFVVLGLWGFNSMVCLEFDRISQKSFSKPTLIYYSEIDDIKLSNACYAKVPPLITLCRHKDKISFEITPKTLNAFLSLCADSQLKDKVRKLLTDNGIY